MEKILQYVEANKSRYLEELKSFLAIPSISTKPENTPDIERCARWVADHLASIGMKNVHVFPTFGWVPRG